jgi:hypothetical protein
MAVLSSIAVAHPKAIRQLEADVAAERDRLMPRKKFAFKGNKKAAPAKDATTTDQGTHNKTMSTCPHTQARPDQIRFLCSKTAKLLCSPT